MDFNEAFDYDSLFHYSSFRGISPLSRRIPPFGRVIVDVGYVDVTEERIMDPAYLLPEHSAVPYYVEERRSDRKKYSR